MRGLLKRGCTAERAAMTCISFYDAQEKPGMVTYNDVDYFYVYNLQGDVVALIDANGTQVVEYGL